MVVSVWCPWMGGVESVDRVLDQGRAGAATRRRAREMAVAMAKVEALEELQEQVRIEPKADLSANLYQEETDIYNG